MTQPTPLNRLYFGDNLNILRDHIADESVDLIYLDPPFNSNATYNVLFREREGDESAAQIAAFEDTWHHLPPLRPHRQPLPQAADGCGVWGGTFSK